MNGCFYVHRRIFDHWIWQNPVQGFRWVDLIGIAAWKGHPMFIKSSRIDLQRGQLAISVRGLARRWKTNNRVVSSFIKILESAGMITCDRSSHSWMIITICNYDKYQNLSDWSPAVDDSEDDSAGVLIDPKEDLSDKNGQKGHHRRHQNKEYNNIINKKNSSSTSVREVNLKFYEELKNDEVVIVEIAEGLRSSREKVLELADSFIHATNIAEKSHSDFLDFKKHFYFWAYNQLEKQKRYGPGKKETGGGADNASPDKYETRRGFDAGDHSEEDYSTSFSV